MNRELLPSPSSHSAAVIPPLLRPDSSALTLPLPLSTPDLGTAAIVAARPARNPVDPARPWAFFVEPECSAAGRVEDVATIFLTNRECPFRCLMCDLWKNTTAEAVPVGAIPAQIDFALERLPPARHVKLYNSGNFFDPRAIPPQDHPAIADRVRPYETVIVENHPRLCGTGCLRFRDRLGANTQLEVALGLETVHPDVLPRLNKQMTLDDFDRAVRLLTEAGIATRAFILLRPPFLSDDDGLTWAVRSIEHAFAAGCRVCSIIATRAGNGIMEQLQSAGLFAPPSFGALERVLQAGLRLAQSGDRNPTGKRRVFVDLWEAETLLPCPHCGPQRIERLRQMNLTQQVLPPVDCACDSRSTASWDVIE